MSEIKLDPNNYRIHNDKNKRIIKKSLEDCGAGRSVLVDKDNVLIAGNGVSEQAQELGLKVRVIESDGSELVVVKWTDLSSVDDKRKLLALADNHASDTSMFDIDLVIDNFTDELLKDWEFTLDDIDISDELPVSTIKPNNLADRFIIPPFSILDAKQGRWQDRKRAWLSLGIKSEEGRDKKITFAHSAQAPAIYEVRNKMREKLGCDPSWEEITDYCRKKNIPMMDGTSIFDPVLCELAYRWFNIPGGKILDPFAGGSVRGIVATKLGMPYRGVEMRKEQVEANYKNAFDIFGKEFGARIPDEMWIAGDSLDIDKHYSGMNR